MKVASFPSHRQSFKWNTSICMCSLFPKFELDHFGSELVKLNNKNCRRMGTFVYCIAVASFCVLAQPAVAQGANTTLPFTYRGRVLQGDATQSCPSEEERGRERNEVDSATLSLLRESVVPLLYPCGGSGWRRVAYLNMSNTSQQCPSVWQEITTPHRVCAWEKIHPFS